MSKDLDMDELVKRRGNIRGRLTKLADYVKDIQLHDITNVIVIELKRRLENSEELFKKFDDIQTSIEYICKESDVDEQLNLRTTIESKFYMVHATIENIIDKHKVDKEDYSDACSNKTGSCQEHGLQSVKLPTIRLPTFDGAYLKWLEFRDTFQSLINLNKSIQNINKFHYLRSSLGGGALEVIKSLEMTSDNYTIAWELLCKRYDNKNILISNHLKALFDIAPLRTESHKCLRDLLDNVSKNLRSLNTLGEPTDKWDTLIIFMLTNKLDPITSMKWEEYKNNLLDIATLDNFYNFIRGRANILETTTTSTAVTEKSDQGRFSNYNKFTSNNTNRWHKKSNFSNNNKESYCQVSSVENLCEKLCLICNEQGHLVYQCEKFKNMKPEDRVKEVTRLKLCSNCLSEGHKVFRCRHKGFCKLCKYRHNTLLHFNRANNNNYNNSNVNVNSAVMAPATIDQAPAVSLSAVSTSQVLLCTAMVEVVNECTQQTCLARVLLDTGSQSSFVTRNLMESLKLPTKSANPIRISGINNMAFSLSERCSFIIKSRLNSFTYKMECLIVPQITGLLPGTPVNFEELNLPKNIKLADPDFCTPSEVNILLGAEVFWSIVGCKRISLGAGKPILQDSQLGWLVSGPVGITKDSQVICNFTREIHTDLKRFWETEEFTPIDNILTPVDKLCNTHFLENMKRLSNGRFSVKIPFKEVPEEALGESYFLAKKRFINLEKRFLKDFQFKQKYCEFIDEYKRLGHLSEIERPKFGYYLPHHAVIKEGSETTKLRVVFDASVKTTTGRSLNDIQYVGPVVQDDLFSILLRFRSSRYVLTADVQKMYRQIEIDPSQRHLQLILWRRDESQPLQVMQLNTVTYGTASAPFLSTRCLVQLANECQDKVIANVLEHDIYMDDLNTGCQTESEIKYVYDSVSKVLASGCFPLHKIRTNCPKVLQDETTVQTLDLSKHATVLGLNWSPSPDTLQFTVCMNGNKKITKRIIISETCKIFDPLGLLSACIIRNKIILQQLWSEKLDWDEPVPPHIAKKWEKIVENINNLAKITLPRNVLCNEISVIELHCFVDASQEAYGACVYLRSIDSANKVTVRLLCAKARVAPLTSTTIPRLELCGALLGARLSCKVVQAIRAHEFTHKYIWTDSTIVLGWIKTQVKTLKTYVSNRVIEINELTQGFSWRHVPSEQNPADLASRGVEPQRLQEESLWWEGPSFLKENSSVWPRQLNREVDLPELKVHLQVENTTNNSIIDFNKYSSFNRLVRIVAYVMRFAYNCKNRVKLCSCLDTDETNKALNILIKLAQLESFSLEVQTLKKGLQLPKNSKILSLNPFIDSEGLLRVGGRLGNSEFDYNKKHPMILDGKHRLTFLLMKHEHHRLCHAGPQLLLASVRELYWPVGGRVLARKVTRQCVVCVRYKGRTIQPQMGNLPSVRTSAVYPFYCTGTDFAGPFLIASKKGRGNRNTKCYLCIFVCLSTRAVHLELVSDLTTQAFILCLKRFVSRRGKPHDIYCDNGTNFVGANNELGRVLRSSRESVTDFASSEGVRFKFSPAYSPHFGGIWEAGVKAAKYHLNRVASNISLTFEELTTLFAQIEGILNSRPLSPLSSDPFDLNPLTPGHFLIGRPLTSIPSPPGEDSRPNYKNIEKIRHDFWQRWRKEFVAELQQRNRWKVGTREPEIGEMVIIKDTNLPPQRWRLGRITRLHMGADNVCRVVDIYTQRGTIRRGIHYIVRLPPDEDIES